MLPSLLMETAITKIKGAQAVIGSNGLITGILCNVAIIRKYTFASLLNCRNRASGLIDNSTWKKAQRGILRSPHKVSFKKILIFRSDITSVEIKLIGNWILGISLAAENLSHFLSKTCHRHTLDLSWKRILFF